MSRYRDSVKDIFQQTGVDITPLSVVLIPVSHLAAVKQTTVKTRGGDSYDAAVFVIPMGRLGKSIQEAPYGEESFCTPPSSRSTMLLESNPRTVHNIPRFVLTWEQLRHLSRALGGKRRPRKDAFEKTLCEIDFGRFQEQSFTDNARRQYYAYAGGPLDEVELLGMYDAGVPTGSKCTMDDIATFVPDNTPQQQQRLYVQWKAVTSAREVH